MWWPRALYEAKPYGAIVAGLGCVAVAWWVERSPRSLLFAAGGVLMVYGVLLWMRRKDYRSTQADYDPRAIDE